MRSEEDHPLEEPAPPPEGGGEAGERTPEAPAADPPGESALPPAEDAPAQDAPAEDAPAENAPAQDAPAEDAPAEGARLCVPADAGGLVSSSKDEKPRLVREAILEALADAGWITWPLPPTPPAEGSLPARAWRGLVAYSEAVSWHAAGVVWAAFVASWCALMGYRAFMRSSLANLLEPKDVPFLAHMQEHFWAYALGCVVLGGLTSALAGVYLWGERADPRRRWLAGLTLAATLVAGITLRFSAPEAGPIVVSDTGVFDWVLLALFLAIPWVGAASRAAEGRAALLPHTNAASPGGRLLFVAPALYVLSVLSIAGFALDEHRTLFDYAKNGKYDYVRFFAEGERALAEQVLASTSLLFGTIAAGLGLCFYALFQASGPRGQEDRWPALRRRALLASLGFALVATVPWMAKASREIAGEANYLFPVAVVGCVLAALFPLLFATAALLEHDLDADCVGLDRWGNPGRLLFAALAWPLYPLIRIVRQGRLRALTLPLYLLVATGLLAGLVWGGYHMDSWWEFEDWRGMMKSGQFPATRVAVSLLAAGAVFLACGRLWRRLGAWVGVPALLGALLVFGLASWPLWAFDSLPRNVHTRCVEFSKRHKFERRFLAWLLDFDRDGYAGTLGGGDPDDRDPEVQGAGLPPLREVALPEDRFRLEDPARARRFPNVVLLTLEGVTPTSITAYGLRPTLKRPATPHMDALAREGARFTRAYAPYPSTWDGWFMLHAGRTLSVQEFDSSLPFGDRYTRYGNLHRLLRQVGIERFCYADVVPYVNLFVPQEERGRLFEPDWKDPRSDEDRERGVTKGDVRVDRVVRFIRSLKPGERFFATEHMGDTHFPWKKVSKERAAELGYPEGLAWAGADAYVAKVRIPRLARYYQQITRMDTQIGRIVAALRAQGVLDQTLIAVISDHGCQWYEHEHIYYVSHLYEQSLRIPWIMRGPGVARGVAIDEPIVQFDFLPTLLDVAGARVEDAERPLEGLSLLPLLRDPSAVEDSTRAAYWKRTLLLKTHYDTLGVLVDFRHKLIVDRPTGVRWLFDLEQDPLERTNLIDARPELEGELQRALEAQAKERMAFLGGLQRSGGRD